MITLDTNLSISPSFYYLLAKLRRKYGHNNKSIDKFTEAHASKGTPQAQKTEETDKTNKTDNVNNVKLKENLDYDQVIKDLKLNLPENRFALLLLMPTSELYEMLKLLGKDGLLNGLKFFTKDKLMVFISRLPKKDLLKMLFYLFTDKTQIIENLPTKEFYRFLSSDKIEKGHFMKVFTMLPRQTLSTIAEYLTKTPCENLSKRDLLEKIEPFKKYQMVNGIKQLDEKTLRGFVTTLTEAFPNLYNEFSHQALFNVSSGFARVDLIDAMRVIDDSKIIDMLTELPEKLVALTVSQINPEVFANLLQNNHKDLLANLVLA